MKSIAINRFCSISAASLPTRERGTEFQKGSDEMDEMTVAELNQYLENIAKLIEASAQDVTAAAQIVRDSKVGA